MIHKFRIQNSEFTLSSPRSAFTLMELLIVIMILTLIAGLSLSALAGATEMAREQRTRAIIAKIDQLIMEKYESYRTRAVPVRVPGGTIPAVAAAIRLNAIRDLMRMEMPDRIADVVDPPCDCDPRSGTNPQTNQPFIIKMQSSSLRNSYIRQVQRNCGANWQTNWTLGSQGAECLYLILSTMQDGDKNALDYFSPEEIGDVDGDGMKEVLDGWGEPIYFIRWPAGYTLQQAGNDVSWGNAGNDDDGQNGTDDVGEWGATGSDDFTLNMTTQSANPIASPDPFDPLKVSGGYALHPLIMSSGRDREFDIATDQAGFHYSPANPAGNNFPNPYVFINVPFKNQPVNVRIGTPLDWDNSGTEDFPDNITNHFLQTP